MTNSSQQALLDTKRVLEHHLGAFAIGVEEILKDYDDNSAVVTPDKVFRGLGDIESFFRAFIADADEAFWKSFKITSTHTIGEVAYISWEAKPRVTMATDTLVVKNGRISTQTFTSLLADAHTRI